MRTRQPTLQRASVGWWLLATFVVAAVVWACGQDTTDDADVDGASSTPPPSGTGTGTAPSPTDDSGHGPGDDGGPKIDTDGSVDPNNATPANFKVAFIADTGTGKDFKAVLQLIKAEGANLILVQGDLNYALLGPATSWFKVIDNEINSTLPGSAATVTIPYFIAKGNHDVDWNGYGSGMKTRMTQWGVTPADGDASKRNYSIIYKGLKIVSVDEVETSPVKRADYVDAQLANDQHLWKICNWHKNQRNSNVGPKSDEMGWSIYERCRTHGAIVAQGHSHTYSRSKTISNDTAQTVDVGCSDPFSLCVGPGKHFFFDSSVGGEDLRPIETDVSALPHFAASYAAAFGALFIEFNVDGDPKTAHGYFKTTGNTIVDPPASSGKTFFTITRVP